jgi:hypothetical protein
MNSTRRFRCGPVVAYPAPGRRSELVPKGESNMLWTIVVILIILWLLGFIGNVGGGLIHLLLVIAVIVVVINLISGRRAV